MKHSLDIKEVDSKFSWLILNISYYKSNFLKLGLFGSLGDFKKKGGPTGPVSTQNEQDNFDRVFNKSISDNITKTEDLNNSLAKSMPIFANRSDVSISLFEVVQILCFHNIVTD
jgi:hypothetical protein